MDPVSELSGDGSVQQVSSLSKLEEGEGQNKPESEEGSREAGESPGCPVQQDLLLRVLCGTLPSWLEFTFLSLFWVFY